MAFEREIQDLETIQRWSTVRMHHRGNVSAHSHRIVIYADQIAEILDWKGDRAALMRYAAWHDMAEDFTGDNPGPMKRIVMDREKLEQAEHHGMQWRFPGMEWVLRDPEIKAIVRIADAMDQIFWVINEMRMGNSMLEEVMQDLQMRLNEVWQPFHEYPRFATLVQMSNEAIYKHRTRMSKILRYTPEVT